MTRISYLFHNDFACCAVGVADDYHLTAGRLGKADAPQVVVAFDFFGCRIGFHALDTPQIVY